ncbi:hypothetical protein NXV89_22660 [Bacteroides uniformis]|nr:hypothetical protein [Bacteroides uniformis]
MQADFRFFCVKPVKLRSAVRWHLASEPAAFFVSKKRNMYGDSMLLKLSLYEECAILLFIKIVFDWWNLKHTGNRISRARQYVNSSLSRPAQSDRAIPDIIGIPTPCSSILLAQENRMECGPCLRPALSTPLF